MGTCTKAVICQLTVVDHDVIAQAAAERGMMITDYLVSSGLRDAYGGGVSRPYAFGDALFGTTGLPDDWYEAASEEDLIEHLKVALRARRMDVAGAMVVELLDFPSNWSDLEAKERGFGPIAEVTGLVDAELVDLVKRTAGREDLASDTSAWDCYKVVLRRAQDFHVAGPSASWSLRLQDSRRR